MNRTKIDMLTRVTGIPLTNCGLVGSINISFEELYAVLKDPHHVDIGDEKVQYEWQFVIQDTPFAIYDYRQGIHPERVTHWHIRSFGVDVLPLIQLLFPNHSIQKFSL